MKQHDILIGKRGGNYLRLPGSEHVVVYARTRAGKTTGFAIPNAFAFGGSLVCLDVKGEIFQATAGHRAAMGQQVIVLDPASPNLRTHRWNPLAAIDRTSPDRFDMIRRQSYSLWPDATAVGTASSNADRFWDPAGRSAFEGVTTLIAESPELPLNMTAVLRMFTTADSHERLARMIEERRKSDARPYSRTAVDQVADYLRGETQQVEGIRKTVSTKLSPWFSPRLQAATECSDFDLRMLRRRPMSIYLTVAPGNIPRMRPYIALFLEQVIALNSDVLPEHDPAVQWQVLLLLDEFLRVGRLVEVAEAGQYVAGYGMRMALIVQDKPQLAARYGEDAMQDIFSNVGAECVFGVNDLKTTRELSERIGFNTVPIATESKPRWWGAFQWQKQSTATRPNQRAAMLPQEIARLPQDEQIVLRAGMMPIRCQRVRWYDDPNFTRLRVRPPEIPQITVAVEADDGTTPVPRPIPRRGDTRPDSADPAAASTPPAAAPSAAASTKQGGNETRH
jgi:type IV secretion system protein VirD4